MKLKKHHSLFNELKLMRLRKQLKKINLFKSTMKAMSDADLQHQTVLFKERLANGETLEDLLPEAYATIREASKRVLGMFPFDVQVLGGIALHGGNIAEMKTGEGKTLTATMPLYLNALSGKGALLVTTNEYLAKRDAEEMGKVYKWLGLTVGVAVYSETDEVNPSFKREIYYSDITYTTSTGLGFDYLADNLASSKEDKFLRPFNFVIVDEADAVLLDSAQTPLIISGSPRVQSNLYESANQFVLTLKKDEEYFFDKDDKVVYLTEEGGLYAEKYFDIEDLYSDKHFELFRHINLALRAHHVYKVDVDYVVDNDEIKLLDNRTGRLMEGTRLQSGIHQAIETKEKVKLTKDSKAVASITYQSLFNMFPTLSGMTGTGKLAEDELISTYKVPVVVIPTNAPLIRVDYPDKVYTTLPEKLYATIEYVKELHEKGQPVLLISGTVGVAEIYSRLLLQEGIPHNVLTAKNIAKEAMIIKEAGQKGAVNVATSIAGRGTDIILGEGVRELGGLAVIGTERMPNMRSDWQLRGRAGRQGDPGLSQFFVSLEDELLIQHAPYLVKRYFDRNNHTDRKNYGQEITKRRYQKAFERAQEKSEDKAVRGRQTTIKFDESLRFQRNRIYRLRDSLIYGEKKLADQLEGIFIDSIDRFLEKNESLTENQLKRYILENYSYQFRAIPKGFQVENKQEVKNLLLDLYHKELQKKQEILMINEKIDEFYRLSVLKAIDVCWISEVDNLQQLKSMVSLRQVAQRNSINEYYLESFRSYLKMEEDVKDSIVRNIMLSTISKDKDGEFSIYYV
ncbi:accessory Sec system translocase SecA2 [Streptococcus cameli]